MSVFSVNSAADPYLTKAMVKALNVNFLGQYAAGQGCDPAHLRQGLPGPGGWRERADRRQIHDASTTSARRRPRSCASRSSAPTTPTSSAPPTTTSSSTARRMPTRSSRWPATTSSSRAAATTRHARRRQGHGGVRHRAQRHRQQGHRSPTSTMSPTRSGSATRSSPSCRSGLSRRRTSMSAPTPPTSTTTSSTTTSPGRCTTTPTATGPATRCSSPRSERCPSGDRQQRFRRRRLRTMTPVSHFPCSGQARRPPLQTPPREGEGNGMCLAAAVRLALTWEISRSAK